MNLKHEAKLFFLWLFFAFSFCTAIIIVCSMTADAQITGREPLKVVYTPSSTDTDLGQGKHLLTLYSAPVRTYNGTSWLDFIRTDYVDGYYVGYTEIDKDEYIWVTNITYGLARVCMNVSSKYENVELPLTKATSDLMASNTAFYRLAKDETYCVWTDISSMKTIKFGEHSTTIIVFNDTDVLDDDSGQDDGDSVFFWFDDMIGYPTGWKWSITRMPAGATDITAILSLTAQGTSTFDNDTDVIACYGLDNDTWTEEDGIIEAHMTASLGNWLSNTTKWSTTGLNNITLGSWVDTKYDQGKQNFSIVCRIEYTDGENDYMGAYSKERTEGYQRPLLFITYTEGGDTTPPSPYFTLPATNNTYTSNVTYVPIFVNATENIFCTLQNGTVNISMTSSGTSCIYNMTGQSNNTQLNYRVFANDTTGNHNYTSWWRTTINMSNAAVCTVTLANTTQAAAQNTTCNASDLLTNWTYWTQWDTHVCGSFNNITWYQNNTLSCDYCTPDFQNGTWNYEGNLTAVYSNVTACNVSGNLTQYGNWTEWNWTALLDFSGCAGYSNTTIYYDNLSWGNWTTLTCEYAPPVPKTVCSIKPVLIFREKGFDIGWVFDC